MSVGPIKIDGMHVTKHDTYYFTFTGTGLRWHVNCDTVWSENQL